MKFGKRIFVLTCAVLIVTCSVYCSIAAEDVFVIGATVSQSGHFSAEVGPFRRLMDAWADLKNEKGGLQLRSVKQIPVKFVVYDDKSEETTTRKSYERLIAVDKVNMLIGPYSSPLTFVASIPAEQHRVPFFAICGNSSKIYERNFKWLVGLLDIGSNYAAYYWDMHKHLGKARSVSFIVEDTLHPQSVVNGSKQQAAAAGLKVISEHVSPADTLDFSAIITKLKAANPDIIFVSANVPFAVRFMKQARELGLNPREYHCIHHSGIFRDPLGETAENVTGQTYWTRPEQHGRDELLINVLDRAKISETLYPWAPAYVAAFETIAAALQQTEDLSPNQMITSLKSLKAPTALGQVSFDSKGYGSINAFTSQIQKGKYEIVWPADRATANHLYPRPNSSSK